MGHSSSTGYSKVALAQWYLEGVRTYGSSGFNESAMSFKPTDLADMAGKVVLITGSNKGLGFTAATELAKLHAEVHLACRDIVKGNEARDKIIAETKNEKVFSHQCDVSNYGNVRSFAATFLQKVPKLDVLVNNAGAMPMQRTLTEEGNESINAVALGGTHLLTDLMMPALRAARGRVINVSSGGMYPVRLDPNDLYCNRISKYDGTLFYAFAKRMQVELTELWAARVSESTGVTVNAMHPGWSTTDAVMESMGDFHKQNQQSFRDVLQGADTIVFLASSQDERVVGKTGLFWFDRQPRRTHMPLGGTVLSEEEKETLWKNACEAVGGITNA